MASYRQLKVSIEPDLADSFKAVCISKGVSMATELSTFMAAKVSSSARPTAVMNKNKAYDTRAKRRRHISRILTQLEAVLEFEDAYLNRIPENLQASQAYENSELSIDSLEQAIDMLRDAY